MNSANVAECSECRQPIDTGNGLRFVCFKIPGTEDYHYFHCRLRGSDCWEAFLKAHRYASEARKR